MWYLTSDIDPRVLYVLPNKEITIGRSVDAQICNFAISDDASISRKHATLVVSENKLYVRDVGSRYGTFVNNMTEKIGDSNVMLNNNDIVRFGKINSVWKVCETSLVTCTSTLKGESLENLKVCLGNLGGVLKSDWDDTCSYLTMPAITLTIKVVLALVQGSHIVTTEFWSKCVDVVRNNTPLPDPRKFIPHVVESTLNKENVSFFPNAQRKSLFTGKTIIFFSRRQLDMYKTVLTKCSATPLLLSDSQMTKSALCEPNVIVIQYNVTSTQETQAQRNQINDIINYLKSKGKRIIADAEIGLAILYCSTDKYCNPDFNFSTEVIKQAPVQNSKPGNILAQESQEPTQKLHNENVVINETLTPTSSKRKLEDDDDEAKASKKFAPEVDTPPRSNNESAKRKLSDDSNDILIPSKKMAVENEDDIFNFQNNAVENGNHDKSEKLLNFVKPVQNKQNNGNDEDDLFNFVQDKPKEETPAVEASNNTMFNKINYIKKEMDEESIQGQKRKLEDDNVDISALRGSKLRELMENQSNLFSKDYNNVKIKKEDPDELDQKMNDLDLGTTILTVRKNLIVKKEPILIEGSEDQGKQLKNFKKFRKVWPVKMQVTVIPKSSMSIIIPDSLAEEITSQSY